jgi:hypothetical protein
MEAIGLLAAGRAVWAGCSDAPDQPEAKKPVVIAAV